MKDILVLGGAGYIGANIVKKLLIKVLSQNIFIDS